MNNDNYKNLLQVVIQKEFKITPDYLEIAIEDSKRYCMGVYLCLGQPIYKVEQSNAIDINDIKTFAAIQEQFQRCGAIFVFLGRGEHNIKKKAEQIACECALATLRNYNNIK